MEQFDFVRNAGETRRYHGWPVLRPQTVAEHSFHVAMILYQLAGTDEPGITVPLLMAGLCHDLAEWKVGDIPSPAKRMMAMPFPNFRKEWDAMEQNILSEVELDWDKLLSPREKMLLELADCLEGMAYCLRERQMGNQLIETPFKNYARYISQKLAEAEHNDRIRGEEMLDHLHMLWEQANGGE